MGKDMASTSPVAVTLFKKGTAASVPGGRSLIQESPLVITVNWSGEYPIMRTPGHDEDLAVGFLFTEGLIQRIEDVVTLRVCEVARGVVDVATADASASDLKRTTTVSSACGLCGRVDLDLLLNLLKPVPEGFQLPAQVLYEVPEKLRQAQGLFHATGASHAVALFDVHGELLVLREDVGRHNAFDKVIGNSLREGRTMDVCGAFLSGRASLEMVIKAARAGIPIVAAVSAPTDAAVQAAERLNITLCGFVRGSEITVYAHPERLRPEGA